MLKYQGPQSKIESGFWSALGQAKLDQLKLDQGPLTTEATYTSSNHAQVPSLLTLSENALDGPHHHRPGTVGVPCAIYCVNTLEQAINADKDSLLLAAAQQIWQSITSGEAETNLQNLQHVVLIAYCDLKQYKYTYWLGTACLAPPSPITHLSLTMPAAGHFDQRFIPSQRILDLCQSFVANNSTTTTEDRSPFFVLKFTPPEQPVGSSSVNPPTASILSFSEATAAIRNNEISILDVSKDDVYLVMIDPANVGAPGWPLQNALMLLAHRWHNVSTKIQVLCLRSRRGRFDKDASLVLDLNLPEIPEDYKPTLASDYCWEVNAQGKLLPRTADLASLMDPALLAASAVDLNLKLMKWRAVQSLDVDDIAKTSCLLLGAGTLGCSVARTLLGWGVRKITFVDNSKVAYSNPVRQSLFNHDDCLAGGRPKAAAAAEALQRIFPGVESRGIEMNIPMPGHPPPRTEIDRVLADVATLEELIQEHDVVFLLLDTRESRWLPALLAAAENKLAITAALGFDGFVVMRHGQGPLVASSEEASSSNKTKKNNNSKRLGCYFCNDVVAPANSTRDRTMDQQCTVARPGLSFLAGALAVEMMVTTLQHPLGIAAPAGGDGITSLDDNRTTNEIEEETLPLGGSPHMIRGQLSGFSQHCMVGQAFSQCTACSAKVVEEYKSRGSQFVLDALNDPRYLEELTGLAQLKRDFDAAEEERMNTKHDVDENDESGGEWEEL